MFQISYHHLEDGGWGVKVSGDLAAAGRIQNMAGQEVEVRKSSGEIKRETLGEKVASWNGGRVAIYRTERRSSPSPEGQRQLDGTGRATLRQMAKIASLTYGDLTFNDASEVLDRLRDRDTVGTRDGFPAVLDAVLLVNGPLDREDGDPTGGNFSFAHDT